MSSFQRQFHTDLGTEALSGTGVERILQNTGSYPTILYGVTIVNQTRPTADPRPAFFYISPDRVTGSRNYGMQWISAYNDGAWDLSYPAYIPQGHYLRMFAYGDAGDIVGFQYSSDNTMIDHGNLHS